MKTENLWEINRNTVLPYFSTAQTFDGISIKTYLVFFHRLVGNVASCPSEAFLFPCLSPQAQDDVPSYGRDPNPYHHDDQSVFH
jgi:hypothetical protein